MTAKPVEWVLVVFYGPAAHQATYGRQVKGGGYTKDYIQLSRKQAFIDEVAKLLSVSATTASTVPLTYEWPTGTTTGAFVFESADRPHLKWETSLGAPKVWKMRLNPSEKTSETIPGDPSHTKLDDADKELTLLASRGAGQPYLFAIKLRDEPRTLHLRVYLKDPAKAYDWANLNLVPDEVRQLASSTSRNSALASSLFQSGGKVASPNVASTLSKIAAATSTKTELAALDEATGRALGSYLRNPGYGLFFDPTKNHDAWVVPKPLPSQISASVDDILRELDARFPHSACGDFAAESIDSDPDEVESFRKQIEGESFLVADSTATIKTRGSAQRAFAAAVKANYGYRCAVTGISTKDFLVASHIVPWSEDPTIRLDPSNGICLSLLVDRAFERGYLLVENDLTIRIDRSRIDADKILLSLVEPYDGKKLSPPTKCAPQSKYLARRRALVDTNM